MHLGWAFESAALRYPEWPALGRPGGVLAYGEWFDRASRLAGWMRRSGVDGGGRVALAMRNSEALATAYMAVQLAGATAVPLNFRFGPAELAHCLADSEATLLVHDDTVEPALGRLHQLPPVVLHERDIASAIDEGPPAPPLANDDRSPSVILYTSGTTGKPKGVPRSHRAEYAATAAHVIQHGYALGERTLGAMPIAHTMGIRSLLSMVLLNGLYVPVASVGEGPVLDLLEEHRVSSLFLVPTAFHLLLERLRSRLPACRKLGYAGAPMTPSLVERCAEAFDPAVFVNHYGSTEVYTFTISNRQREKPGCAGRAGFHTRIRLVTASPERRVGPGETVPPGEPGEVIAAVDGDEAFTGYLNRPDATAHAVRDGWYFTGDVGRVDDEGDLWVEGRVDDMIITGGENVYPLEVEDALSRHPQVAEAVVCGLPDERWGQLVTAFVVPRAGSGLTVEEVDRLVREDSGLASFKRPRRIVLVRAIPKSPVGKVLRRELLAGRYEPLPA
jgi:2-furoate---CoA ligase